MSGTLYVVATPIGNLEDITFRAVRVLRSAAIIAAEDTRRTGRLLAHHGIQARTMSFHEHNAKSRVPQLLRRLQAGDEVALVTDAGTPGVSDPGLELVRACVEHGITIDPVPGASAPLTALVASGFPLIPFTIYGFAPNRSKARNEWLAKISETAHTFSFFEAPHRIQATLNEAAQYFGNRPIVLGRELTKLHQEFLRGTAVSLAEELADARGEFTVVVGPSVNALHQQEILSSDEELANQFWQMASTPGVTRRSALSCIAKQYGKSQKEIYAAVERAKKLGY